MKKFLFALLTVVAISGCSTRSEIKEEIVDLSAFAVMQEAMNMSFNDLTYLGDIMNNPTRTCSDEEIVETFNNIKDVVLPYAEAALENSGLSETDMLEIFTECEASLETYEANLVSISMLIGMFQTSSTRGETWDDITDCFIKATGLAAGVELVGVLSAKTMSKTVIKSVLKVITKETLKKAVPGIGLGIILVETVHCSLT